ncbi:purF [Symbiodinium microadriaticum]|nr:purF [Symbiodinium microadriaticum]
MLIFYLYFVLIICLYICVDLSLGSGFSYSRDVSPGEAVLVTLEGTLFSAQCHASPVLAPCIFEYVYFARPDTVLDGVSVYEARLNMGEKLAHKLLELCPDHDIDVVMPIPDTSRVSALQCAVSLRCPYREGFVKNRYIARTFIMPGQETRRKTVQLKLNTVKAEFAGKSVLMVDDSIVRGTTSSQIIQMARQAGARKIYFASAAPPVRYPNVYGIDIPSRGELVAHDRDEAQIAAAIGADMVIYNDLADLEACIRCVNPLIHTFDTSCFSGLYVTPEVTAAYLSNLEEKGRGSRRGGPAGAASLTPCPAGLVIADDVRVTTMNGRDEGSTCEGMYNSRTGSSSFDYQDEISKRQRLS